MIALAPRPRAVFYLDADGLTVWQPGTAGWTPQARFGATSTDHTAFAAWLDTQSPALRGTVIVDSVEESYTLTTLPPASGRDRRALLQRALQRHFPFAAYTTAIALGRETDGRRDERMLLCALPNSGPFTTWLDALRARPDLGITAIHSPTLLGADLVRRIWRLGERCVLASFTTSGMRHSFFVDRRLHFSRVATACRLPPPAEAGFWRDELRRTRAYLADQRLIEHDARLPLIVVADVADHGTLGTVLADLDGFNLRFQPLATTSTADATTTPLFVRHAARHPQAPHYRIPGADDRQRLQRLRRTVLGSGIAALALGVAGALSPMLDTLALRTRTQLLADELERARSTLSATPAAPAVPLARLQALATTLDQHQHPHRPAAPVFRLVSEILDDAPWLELDALAWREADASVTPPHAPAQTLIELHASMRPSAPADRTDAPWNHRSDMRVLSQQRSTAQDGNRTHLHLRFVVTTPEAR